MTLKRKLDTDNEFIILESEKNDKPDLLLQPSIKIEPEDPEDPENPKDSEGKFIF